MNPPPPKHRRLRPSGGYRLLRSFQTATLIYDGTWHFCERFIDRRSRTHDQMVQAARSGRQNIAEGNHAGAVSTKSEMELTNVARASLEELLLDYQDYLRHRKLPLWAKTSREASQVRALSQQVAAIQDPLARLVAAGVLMRRGLADPLVIASAIDAASSQGWRRPLLVWLGVQAHRAEQADDREALARIRRRMALVGSDTPR